LLGNFDGTVIAVLRADSVAEGQLVYARAQALVSKPASVGKGSRLLRFVRAGRKRRELAERLLSALWPGTPEHSPCQELVSDRLALLQPGS